MYKATTLGYWIVEMWQIYFCWEHYYQFTKNIKSKAALNIFDK